MAESITVARPYAQAAYKLAVERAALDQWARMLNLVVEVVCDERIAALIGNPNVQRAQLESVVLGVCGDKLDGAGRNFVQVLIENGRLAQIKDIRALYEHLKLEHEGVLEAQIYSAFPIDDAQASELVAQLESKYQRKIRPHLSVDPQLIGGVRIVVGDRVLDASVRGRLDAMSAALTR